MLLEAFRPAFRRSSVFALFAVPAAGLVTRTAGRTAVGMLAGAGMAAVVSFHATCRFCAQHSWATDQLGLLLVRLIDTDAAITVAIDDSTAARRALYLVDAARST